MTPQQMLLFLRIVGFALLMKQEWLIRKCIYIKNRKFYKTASTLSWNSIGSNVFAPNLIISLLKTYLHIEANYYDFKEAAFKTLSNNIFSKECSLSIIILEKSILQSCLIFFTQSFILDLINILNQSCFVWLIICC